MRLVGILGGTFDPIHLGHLRTASELLDELPLDEIRFMLCGSPPHRRPPCASPGVRWEMLSASVHDQPGLVADGRELQRDGPSYTVDTLADMREEDSQRRLALIMGMDAFVAFDTWYRWETILELAHLVVVQRPGSEPPASGEAAELLQTRRISRPKELTQHERGRILVAELTQLEISSTAIRELVAQRRDPRFLVTDAVRGIIASSGCYSPEAIAQHNRKEVRFSA